MYAMLTLNLIVNCVTLISSLLLITGAIRVSIDAGLSAVALTLTVDFLIN